MRDDDPIQEFDLPDDCEIDRVQIYRLNLPTELYPDGVPGGPEFEAVPYVHREDFNDDLEWYDEPADFTPTEEYRDAIAERAIMDIENIQLSRQTATYHVNET